MRSPALHRLFHRLALIAALLLALAPTMGRMLGGTSAGPQVAWVQICTMAGLKLVEAASTVVDPGQTHPPDAGQNDCSYCPLLSALTALAVLVALLVPGWPNRSADIPLRRRAVPGSTRHPSGLGSRGPPLVA